MMKHPIYKVRSVQVVAPYTLCVGFDDATEQMIDFRPVLAGELYGPLRELALFNQVKIDSEVHTLVWPNGADFDPSTLHDWPENATALAERAREWESQRLMLEMKIQSVMRQATCAVKNLILAMNGEKPIAQVNPEVPVKKVV